jgi:hypothetical protein
LDGKANRARQLASGSRASIASTAERVMEDMGLPP